MAAALIASTFPNLFDGALATSLPDFGSLTDSACFAFRFRIADEFAAGLAASGFFAELGGAAGRVVVLRATILAGARAVTPFGAFVAADFDFAAFALGAVVVCADVVFTVRAAFVSSFLTGPRAVPLVDFGVAVRGFAEAFAFATAGLADFTGAVLAAGRLAFARTEAIRGAATRAFFGLVSLPRFAILLRAAVDFAAFDFAWGVFAWEVLDFGVLAIFLTEDIRGALLFGSALETERSSSGEWGVIPPHEKEPIVRPRQDGSTQASHEDHPHTATRPQGPDADRSKEKESHPQSFHAQRGRSRMTKIWPSVKIA